MSAPASTSPLFTIHHPIIPCAAPDQGLTLVHLSAQRKRFRLDRGCIQGVCTGWLRGVFGAFRGIRGCLECILYQKQLRLS